MKSRKIKFPKVPKLIKSDHTDASIRKVLSRNKQTGSKLIAGKIKGI